MSARKLIMPRSVSSVGVRGAYLPAPVSRGGGGLLKAEHRGLLV